MNRGGDWRPYCRRPECKLCIVSRYERHNSTWESWHTSAEARWKKKGGEACKRKEYVRGKIGKEIEDKNR